MAGVEDVLRTLSVCHHSHTWHCLSGPTFRSSASKVLSCPETIQKWPRERWKLRI